MCRSHPLSLLLMSRRCRSLDSAQERERLQHLHCNVDPSKAALDKMSKNRSIAQRCFRTLMQQSMCSALGPLHNMPLRDTVRRMPEDVRRHSMLTRTRDRARSQRLSSAFLRTSFALLLTRHHGDYDGRS